MTDQQPKILVDHVCKSYRVYQQPIDRLKELLSPRRRVYHTQVDALRDVSLTVEEGERIGILGENGSGKSTLLKLISNVLSPTSGTVLTHGSVSALLELGSGFNPEFTGRQNIYQNALVRGVAPEALEALLPQIIAFSELGDFIDHPVKTYSSGMGVRLGFSCAVHIDPDILIIDEALSVGDAYFQNKCLHKIKSLLNAGATFLYVSHNPDSVKALCNRAIWLHHGEVVEDGPADAVGQRYEKFLWEKSVRASWSAEPQQSSTKKSMPPAKKQTALYDADPVFASRVDPLRTGDGRARVENIQLLTSQGPTDVIPSGETIVVRVHGRLIGALPTDTAVCVGISNRHDLEVLHLCSLDKELDLSSYSPGDTFVLDFELENPLSPGEYSVGVGINSMTRSPKNPAFWLVSSLFDYCVGGTRFSVPETSVQSSAWGAVVHPYEAQVREVGRHAEDTALSA